MSGIISSCCPFLTNATREGRCSPPYTTEDVRLRLHNWTNSLSGSTQIPRQISASGADKPGLPEMSSESSAITFIKSDTSFDPGEGDDAGEGEDAFKVILPVRKGCFDMDQAMAAAAAADFHPIPDGDWETEKGLEEEEVTLLERKQAGDDEVGITCLERKSAKTVLRLQPHTICPTLQLSAPLPFKSKAPLSPSLPQIAEQSLEHGSLEGSEPIMESSGLPEEISQDMSEAPTFTEQCRISPAYPEPSVKLTSSASSPAPTQTVEDPTQASASSELLDAISNISAARSSGKSRRSRMTNTRAPTPWSAAEHDEENEDETPPRVAEDNEQLERADSSGSNSPFESVADTTESSYHTLPTVSSSVERADRADDPPMTEQPRQITTETGTTTAGEGVSTEGSGEAEGVVTGHVEETTAELATESETEAIEARDTEPAEEILAGTRVTAVRWVARTAVQPAIAQAAELGEESAAESSAEPNAEELSAASATGPALDTSPDVSESSPDVSEDTAAGDQPPVTIPISDEVNLRYFCGAFRPVDHYMTRYAGLEEAATAPKPQLVPSGRSDSCVQPSGEGGADRRRGTASDSTLPLGARSSSPGAPSGDDSGVKLEAKRSTTDIPI